MLSTTSIRTLRTLRTLMVCLVIATAFTACKRAEDKKEEIQANIDSSRDNALLENEVMGAFDIADNELRDPNGSSGKTGNDRFRPDCVKVTRNTTGATKTTVLSFEATALTPKGCLCRDGKTRKGIIRITHTGEYRMAGSTTTATLENFVSDDLQLSGTWQTTNITEGSGNPRYSIKVTNATATNSDGTRTWNADRTIERTKGAGTLSIWDDAYSISGGSSGTNRSGVNYTVTITKPLVKDFDKCKAASVGRGRFVSGAWKLKNSNGGEMALDYDPDNNAACDTKARVTIENRSFDIFF